MNENIINNAEKLFSELENIELYDRIEIINSIREKLAEYSPFKNEPVDCIKWVLLDEVIANDYNPNNVAPPEMELLRHSINHDGYTQPVVTWKADGHREVIDGFHRTRVCQEFEDVNKRVHGYLPVVTIKEDCTDRNDRVASTIRHNRARGKHMVDSMSEIVVDLKRRNWSPKKIAKELGMDQDEILRLTQISGLAEMFSDSEFTEAWEAESLTADEFEGDLENVD